MKGFWNDGDGLSIGEFISMMFSLSYLFMVGLMSYCMIMGIEITDTHIRVFETMSYPVLVILGGQFAGHITDIVKNKSKSTTSSGTKSDDQVTGPVDKA